MFRFAFLIPLALFAFPVHAEPDKLCGGTVYGRTLEVSKATATCQWPFTVPEATIICQGSDHAGPVFVEFLEYGRWALNGTATHYGYKIPDETLHAKEDPNEKYGYIDLGPWIAAGHEVCP